MDQILVWCDDDEPTVGDEIVLIGTQAAAGNAVGGELEVRMSEWAENADTITYEIATGIGARVPRVVC